MDKSTIVIIQLISLALVRKSVKQSIDQSNNSAFLLKESLSKLELSYKKESQLNQQLEGGIDLSGINIFRITEKKLRQTFPKNVR